MNDFDFDQDELLHPSLDVDLNPGCPTFTFQIDEMDVEWFSALGFEAANDLFEDYLDIVNDHLPVSAQYDALWGVWDLGIVVNDKFMSRHSREYECFRHNKILVGKGWY